MANAQENRQRILAKIDQIMNDAYKAPEVKRSKLYEFMIEEFNKCTEWALKKAREELKSGKIK